jgi:hypothetical protein
VWPSSLMPRPPPSGPGAKLTSTIMPTNLGSLQYRVLPAPCSYGILKVLQIGSMQPGHMHYFAVFAEQDFSGGRPERVLQVPQFRGSTAWGCTQTVLRGLE